MQLHTRGRAYHNHYFPAVMNNQFIRQICDCSLHNHVIRTFFTPALQYNKFHSTIAPSPPPTQSDILNSVQLLVVPIWLVVTHILAVLLTLSMKYRPVQMTRLKMTNLCYSNINEVRLQSRRNLSVFTMKTVNAVWQNLIMQTDPKWHGDTLMQLPRNSRTVWLPMA